ncbi:DMT family transporter [Pseudomonas sp. 15FMM2]|uniref:DMT family transporter n=1 Tax=Pseudomonas imrae TaxID=2992837 RepID=A0ACC7PKL5_9PSED
MPIAFGVQAGEGGWQLLIACHQFYVDRYSWMLLVTELNDCLAGAIVSGVGLCVFLLNGSERPLSWPGVALALLAFLAVACGAVISEQVQKTWHVGALQINKVAAGWAGLLYGLTLLVRGQGLDVPVSVTSIGVLLYLGVVCSALVFVLFIDLIRRVGAENAGYVGVLYPIGASYLAVLLGETSLSLAMMVGSALVALGSFINFKCRYNPTQKKLELT